jgi:flagellar export protein FliJ
MKKFSFRLQKLLQVKTYSKLQRQKELSQAERVRRMEEAHLIMLQERMRQEISDLAPEKKEYVNITRLSRSVYYQQRLVNNMATQTRVITEALHKEDLKRGELVEATKVEKTFEKLKERQQERYLIELDHTMQKETDEIAKNIFIRQRQQTS